MKPECAAFLAWLDEGMPEGSAVAFAAGSPVASHAASCASCARALASARELDSALSASASRVRAPLGFTDTVMARIAVAPVIVPPFARDSFAWWLRAAAHPATALSLALTAVVWAGREAMVTATLYAILQVAVALQWLSVQLAPIGAALTTIAGAIALDQPGMPLALTLGLAPTVVLASIALYRWSARGLIATPRASR